VPLSFLVFRPFNFITLHRRIKSLGELYAGGLVAFTYNSTVTITNGYSLVLGNGRYNGEPCTAEQLNSKAFYVDTLGWSEDIWDFSDLDVENGKSPTLKA
jgi:hypothetical protein